MSIMEVTVIGLQRANGSDINLHSPERSRPYTEVCKSLIFFCGLTPVQEQTHYSVLLSFMKV